MLAYGGTTGTRLIIFHHIIFEDVFCFHGIMESGGMIFMITTTLSSYPGKKIVKDLGIVFAYDDAVRPTRLAMNMEKYLETALKRLSEKAQEKGANAVLGICFDLRDTLKPMLMGTAVVLEDE